MFLATIIRRCGYRCYRFAQHFRSMIHVGFNLKNTTMVTDYTTNPSHIYNLCVTVDYWDNPLIYILEPQNDDFRLYENRGKI